MYVYTCIYYVCRYVLYLYTSFICILPYMYFSDKYRYYKITNVSIFVLGIYTCGISALIWWMYKRITDNGASSSEDKKGMYVC